jgi:hypothetical protein
MLLEETTWREDNIKMDIKLIKCKAADWINLAQGDGPL